MPLTERNLVRVYCIISKYDNNYDNSLYLISPLYLPNVFGLMMIFLSFVSWDFHLTY